MEELKLIPRYLINKVRNSPKSSGLAFNKIGFPKDLEGFSDYEIMEMMYGIYKKSLSLLVDGDYFIDLNDVIESVCELAEVTYFTPPTDKDFKTNHHNNIKNIRTFYVRDYFLVTRNEREGVAKHRISRYLVKVGAINPGRNRFAGLYSNRNYYKTLQDFQDGLFPKDLYYPIKKYINGLFFNDEYRISKFRVESSLKIELQNK